MFLCPVMEVLLQCMAICRELWGYLVVGLPLCVAGAKTPGAVLLEQEESSNEVAHLSERQAGFGPSACPCHDTALKWSLA